MEKTFDKAYGKARGSLGYGKGPSQSKAKEILKDGMAQGHALTKKQKGFFGDIAGGQKAKK